MRSGHNKIALRLIILFALFALWGQLRPTGGIVGPTPWEAESRGGRRALDAKQFDDVEKLFTSALRLAEHNKRPGELATSYQNLGDLRAAQHRYAEARDHFAKAIPLLERDSETPPRQMVAALCNYGSSAGYTGDYATAERIMRRAIQLKESQPASGVLVSDARRTLRTDWLNLAAVLVAQGRGAEGTEARRVADSLDMIPTPTTSGR